MSIALSPCSRLGTMTLNVTLPVGAVAPANGYRVLYRPLGSTEPYVVANSNQNPIVVWSVPLCYDLEVKVQANCGDGVYGDEVSTTAFKVDEQCFSYRLTTFDVQYTYRPCGASQNTTIYNSGNFDSQGLIICAAKDSVSGGVFSSEGACTA